MNAAADENDEVNGQFMRLLVMTALCNARIVRLVSTRSHFD